MSEEEGKVPEASSSGLLKISGWTRISPSPIVLIFLSVSKSSRDVTKLTSLSEGNQVLFQVGAGPGPVQSSYMVPVPLKEDQLSTGSERLTRPAEPPCESFHNYSKPGKVFQELSEFHLVHSPCSGFLLEVPSFEEDVCRDRMQEQRGGVLLLLVSAAVGPSPPCSCGPLDL